MFSCLCLGEIMFNFLIVIFVLIVFNPLFSFNGFNNYSIQINHRGLVKSHMYTKCAWYDFQTVCHVARSELEELGRERDLTPPENMAKNVPGTAVCLNRGGNRLVTAH